jgi:hypothetical protein
VLNGLVLGVLCWDWPLDAVGLAVLKGLVVLLGDALLVVELGDALLGVVVGDALLPVVLYVVVPWAAAGVVG